MEMAAKRLPNDGVEDQFGAKRMKGAIKQVTARKSLQNLLAMIEPTLRRVVHEEVQRGMLQRAIPPQTSPPKQPIQQSSLRLAFTKRLSLPIFTSSKIEDEESNPLQVAIIDSSGEEENLISLPSSIKLEIVVVNGDFPSEELDDWAAEEFDRNIVRERAGKRPLLTGDVSVTMKDRVASMEGLTITDNSSWIRCRHFRIGARVACGSCGGLRIREAITERFTVKDHRGELYKKSYPPSLNDEVWRLQKIGKDGAFHRRLSDKGIGTVQDFLKQWVVDPHYLKKILGQGMSDRTWETTTKHANTCELGSKLYLYSKLGSTILLNPICQVVGAVLNGVRVSLHEIAGPQKAFVEQMVLEAHRQWNTLEEIDKNLESAVLSQSAMMMQHPSSSGPQGALGMPTYASAGLEITVEDYATYGQADYGAWYRVGPVSPNRISRNPHATSDLSSDNDSITSHAFFQ